MSEDDLSIFAHLMRRAGFGATRRELDCLAAKGYEAVVEDLVNPERLPEFEADLEGHYFGNEGRRGTGGWFYRMVNSQRQLEEKIQFFNSEPRSSTSSSATRLSPRPLASSTRHASHGVGGMPVYPRSKGL